MRCAGMLDIEIPEENRRKDAIIEYQAYTIKKMIKTVKDLRQEIEVLKANLQEKEQ